MNEFTFHNPVKLIFGKGQLRHIIKRTIGIMEKKYLSSMVEGV